MADSNTKPPRKHAGGRRKGATKTREAILRAAVELFAKNGYEGATLRAIGERAGVDPALINHFFGGKQGLFDEAVLKQGEKGVQLIEIAMDPDRDSAEALLDAYFRVWEEPRTAGLMAAVIRSSLESDTNRDRLQEMVTEGFARAFESAVQRTDSSGSQDKMTWQLLASELLGVSIGRYVLQLKPLADLSREELVTRLVPTVEAYLPTGGRSRPNNP